jgi:hypothetical protein
MLGNTQLPESIRRFLPGANATGGRKELPAKATAKK